MGASEKSALRGIRQLEWLAVLSSFLFTSWLFFDLTADDAYIVYRYVENLHRHGALTFNANAGEQIDALTSPLHAFFLAGLYSITRECVLTNKIAGLTLLLLTAATVGYRHRRDDVLSAFVVSLIILPSCVVLWTFGGLETPLLLSLVAAATLVATNTTATPRNVYAVCLLGGLGFLARHDSVLYFAPLALAALLREPSWRHRLQAVALGAVLPIAWLASAFVYYGDVLPTSYYTKTPHLTRARAILNAKYIVTWLCYAGLVPALAVWWLGANRPLFERIGTSLKSHWPIYAGLALELAYGLSMATTHMMFSFRFFVPYVPAAAILIAESIRADQTVSMGQSASRRWRAMALTFVAGASACHAAFAWYVYSTSLNGSAPAAEFHATPAREFMGTFVRTLHEQADVIRQDWAKRPASAERAPRIAVYAGGILPYSLPDAYVYENLASYRHGARKEFIEFAEFADYTVTVVPFFGTEEELRQKIGEAERIFSRDWVFEGMPNSYRVYFNSRPRANQLCGRIDCSQPVEKELSHAPAVESDGNG